MQRLNKPRLLTAQFLLDKMVDLEPLLGFLVQVPRVETQHSMELRIQSCLSLRQLLECVEPLRLLLSKAGPDSLLARYASVRNTLYNWVLFEWATFQV